MLTISSPYVLHENSTNMAVKLAGGESTNTVQFTAILTSSAVAGNACVVTNLRRNIQISLH